MQDHSDISISTDADLQDDINAIVKMVDKNIEGYDIVYGVRNKRKQTVSLKDLPLRLL